MITFDQKMLKQLKPLAQTLLEEEKYYYLSRVSDMLVGFSSGRWGQLGDDEREFYLEQLKVDFHPRGMGDSIDWNNPNYTAITELIDYAHRGLIKKRT